MDTTELALMLADVPGIGDRRLLQVLHALAVSRLNPDDLATWSAEDLVRKALLPPRSAECVVREWARRAGIAAETAREMRRRGVTLLTPLSASYPAELTESMDHPPTTLFVYGRLDAIWDPSFALAVSNGAPEEEVQRGEAAAALAQECGLRAVTGHNRQAYQRTALVARRAGRPITYVLDRGMLDACGGDLSRDLFAAARIWSPALDTATDLVLSPFGLRDHGTGANNRRRDEMIFALAWVVLAGYVRTGGVMESVCLRALERGAPVAIDRSSPAARSLSRAGADPLRFDDEEILRQWLEAHAERPTE